MADLRERRAGGGSVDPDDFNAVLEEVWNMQTAAFTPAGHLEATNLTARQVRALAQTPIEVVRGEEGKIPVPLSFHVRYVAVSTPYTGGSDANFYLVPNGQDTSRGLASLSAAALDSAESQSSFGVLYENLYLDSEVVANGLSVQLGDGAAVGGDGTVVVTVGYFYVNAA